ncbi:MAG: Holliday junction resolvase RuvX [Candidatus Daviesbacteria bacterium]|nr:Holliday junction resolvase RuvX [Candidatus Daviesbacteria bacterium]
MKYLGVDFGLRRIGLAISDGELASPWQVIDAKKFSETIKKDNFEKIIVGLPEGKMGKNVAGFVNALRKQGFVVETADETLSSQKALEVMIEQDRKQKKRRSNDATAAAIILQNYLDSQ